MSFSFQIRSATEADLPAILAIFNDLVLHSDAVYTEQPATLAERQAWFAERVRQGFPVLVAEGRAESGAEEEGGAVGGGEVLGVASFAPFRPAWPGYRHTVEHSVHVRRDQYRRGIGAALLRALLPLARAMDMHVMLGVIDAANEASLRLHERLGFKRVGLLPEVGRKFGRWLDVVFVQCHLAEDGARPGRGGAEGAEAEAGAADLQVSPRPAASTPTRVAAPSQTAMPSAPSLPAVSSASARLPAQAGVQRAHLTRHGRINLKHWPGDVTQPTVVLLHGLFGSVDVWAATALNLNRAGLDVLAIDLPAHGASEARADSLEAVVEAVDAVLQAERLSRVALVGHSFGCMVAATLIQQQGISPEALVLLAPPGMGPDIDRRFVDGVLAARDPEALADALARLTVRHYRVSPAYLKAMLARLDAVRAPLQTLVGQMILPDGTQRHRILEVLSALRCPLTLVQGREDGVLPWQQVLQAPPQAAVHLLPAVGHMPHWEANALTTRLIQQTVSAGH